MKYAVNRPCLVYGPNQNFRYGTDEEYHIVT
jgi:hypothetical protein